MPSVLFVCLGNICRSPLAEGIFIRQAGEVGLTVRVDSAGIGHWHVGESADPRAIRVGEARGCRMTMRARQIRPSDFEEFDYIVAMDNENMRALSALEGFAAEKTRLARSFDPAAEDLEVPDPYYGTTSDFYAVAEMLEEACRGLIRELRSEQTNAVQDSRLEEA